MFEFYICENNFMSAQPYLENKPFLENFIIFESVFKNFWKQKNENYKIYDTNITNINF